jgi:hypothetical protein
MPACSDYSLRLLHRLYQAFPTAATATSTSAANFGRRLDAAPIAATSVLNGMLTDLLLKEAPLIQAGLKRVLYWGLPTNFLTLPP